MKTTRLIELLQFTVLKPNAPSRYGSLRARSVPIGLATAYLVATLTSSLALADEGIKAPFPYGTRAPVTQGANNSSSVSHTGMELHAVDFGVPEGTPVDAVKDGVITHAVGSNSACGGPEMKGKANYVVLKTNDGTAFLYLHLSRVDVTVGQQVTQGQRLGAVGKTGYTNTGSGCRAHLHLQRQQAGSSYYGDSIPMKFDEIPGRELVKGDSLTSQNRLKGDINKDGKVNLLDYSLFYDNFGSTNCGNIADIDGDCRVGIQDYSLLFANYGKTST